MRFESTLIPLFIYCVAHAVARPSANNWFVEWSLRTLFDPTCEPDEQPGYLQYEKNIGQQAMNRRVGNSTTHHRGSHQPWKNEPFCVSALDQSSLQYCVWTSPDFRNGRGITVMAREQSAATLASTTGFLNNLRDSESQVVKGPGYEVVRLRGRGFGLVANSTFERGDLILFETPLILAEASLEDNIPEVELRRLHRRAVESLPRPSQELVMRLHGHPDGGSIYDRFGANAFKIFDFAGLFPSVARLNHDCRPNGYFHFDKKTFTQRIYATRSIVPGEEITISYLSHYLTSKERFSRMRDQWGFQCTCKLCSASRGSLAISDGRLLRIQELEGHLMHVEDGKTVISIAEDLISLYKEETLDATIAKAYDHLAMAFSRLGHVAKAKEYATKGLEAAEIWPGPGSKESMRMQRLIADEKD